MSLKTEVIKGFLVTVSLQLCLRDKKAIRGMRYVHKIGEKEHFEILLVFRRSVYVSVLLPRVMYQVLVFSLSTSNRVVEFWHCIIVLLAGGDKSSMQISLSSS